MSYFFSLLHNPWKLFQEKVTMGMPLCMWVVDFMPLLEQSYIIKIHARSTLKGKMIVTSQLICFPHSQVARLVLLQALIPNLHLNLSVLFDLAKKTKIIHVTKCVTSHPWLCNQVHLKEEKMNWARLRKNVCPFTNFRKKTCQLYISLSSSKFHQPLFGHELVATAMENRRWMLHAQR